MNRTNRTSTALTLLLCAGAVFAQAQAADAPPAPTLAAADTGTAKLESVVITGTRARGLKVEDSVSPIQVLDAATIASTGEADLMQALGQAVPSMQIESFGFDTAALTKTVRLRGVSPNDTLVLINGKRRHGTANLTVDTGSPFIGSAAADLGLIPILAISSTEVLTDGAAAVYGTDAVAGVVNISLSKADHGSKIQFETGGYFDEGGRAGDLAGNFGFKPWEGAFANLTLETRYSGYSNRGAIDPRVVDPTSSDLATMQSAPKYPYMNQISGDPSIRTHLISLNAGSEVTPETSVYFFGTYGHKVGLSYENYRLPSKARGIYPLGFNPSEGSNEEDFALTLGGKGTVAGWNWDLSTTYGKDVLKIGTYNTINPGAYGDPVQSAKDGINPNQQNFQDGEFHADQWTNNLGLDREYEVGWSSPLTVAFGLEQRTDTFEIVAGEPASRYAAGPSSYPGFTLTDAGSHSRRNEAFYLDLEGSPIKPLSLAAAVRAEHYTDFGSTTVGKFSGRYEAAPGFALRGTISSGFRAPTLNEEYYSATNVGPSTAFVQLPPNSVGAGLVGVNGLKAEKSDNLSFGLVLKPTPESSLSLDMYQITIRDRIVGSGSVFGNIGTTLFSTPVNNAIAANGNVLDPAVLASPIGQTGINIFSNAVNTRTRGAEFVSTLVSNYAEMGRVDWSLAASWNSTTVTKVNQAPTQLQQPASEKSQTLLDKTALSQLETASPRWRANLGAVWHFKAWTFDLKENYYGESSDYEAGEDGVTYYKNTVSAKVITNFAISNEVFKGMTVTVGANNLFNQYPDKRNSDMLATFRAAGDNAAVSQYPIFSPWGINGGFYYARATYAF
jgi:iron complex outermembrane receptor protein